MIRIGTVSSVNLSARTARVRFHDLGYTSGDLRVLQSRPMVRVEQGFGPDGHRHEVTVTPWMPAVDDTVVCQYAENSKGAGIITGRL